MKKPTKKVALIETTTTISNRDLSRALMVALASRQPVPAYTVEQVVIITVQPADAQPKGTKGKL